MVVLPISTGDTAFRSARLLVADTLRIDQGPIGKRLMIAVPLLYPVAMQLGIHPIHFGIVCILNLSIGALTPPFGAVMYQCCNLCKIEMPEFLKQGKELIGALFISLLLVTFIPAISTFLPTIFK